MKRKLRVGVLFGGRSGEHEVSLLSAASVLGAIDRSKYEVVPIGIARSGLWLHGERAKDLLAGRTGLSVSASAETSLVSAFAEQQSSMAGLDVVLPVLHGTYGEDGTIQGLLEMAGVAYAGSGVLGSAVGMDKDVMRRLFAVAGLPQTPYVSLLRTEWAANPLRWRKHLESRLTYPFFVKPANLGSSVGISKVHDRSELEPAMRLAARFDRKLLVEQGVGGPGVKPRELEIGVLGNDAPETSVIGEIVPNREFYDYDSKYAASEAPSIPLIPARLTRDEQRQVRKLAVAAFRACDAAGLARVDFLLDPAQPGRSSVVYLNEINTMPGFTAISMFPKLWEASGVPYAKLIDRVIDLALERAAERLQTAFSLE